MLSPPTWRALTALQALKLSIGDAFKHRRHKWSNNAKALKAMVRMYKISRDAQVCMS